MNLEFQVDEPADTGLFLRTNSKGDGYQVTIDCRPGGTIGDIYVPSAGFIAQGKGRTFYKPGKWNKLRAKITGSPAKIEVLLNGKQTVKFTDTRSRLGGRIALQVHGGGGSWGDNARARFKNITVKAFTPPMPVVEGMPPLPEPFQPTGSKP